LQALHADWGEAPSFDQFQVCNSIWLIDDFTAENGATRAVPGSHRWGKPPKQVMEDPRDDHPAQQLFLYPKGTVIVFNSHTWHGGTLNRTSQKRRAMHAYFTRRSNQQQLPQREYLSPKTIETLTPAERWLLAVEK